MNRYEELFQILNEPDLSNNETIDERQALVSVLKEFGEILADDSQRATDIAYSIAGLMATDYARQLPDDDPISEVLAIAGELEIMPENSNELLEELKEKIGKL